MFETDVFIIGGGPAGLAAAIAARRKGLRVVVADGNRPPIDKACGEGLMPDSRRAAEKIGITIPDSLGFLFQGIRFHGGGRSVQACFPEGHGIGVRRTVLHQELVEIAERSGAELRWQTPVSGIGHLRAKWIVGADGSKSAVRRLAGLNSYIQYSQRFAYRQHFRIVPWTDYMEIYWGDGCQAYVTPVAPDEVCIALITRTPEVRFEQMLAQRFPELRERLARAHPSSRERGALTVTMRLESVARGNVALIGDASGSVDAITGEGLCLNFRQAALLADALADGDLSRYNHAHPRLAWRPHLMAKTMLLLDLGYHVRRLALGALSTQPRLFQRLLAVHVA